MALNGPPALSCLLGGEIFNLMSTQKSSNVRGPRGREIVITGWERGSGSLARRGSHALSAPSTGLTQACQSASPVWSLQGSQDFQDASVPPPFLVWRLAPSPARWSPLAISLLGALALPKSHPPQAFDPRQLEPPTSNSRNTSQCNNTSPSRCWGGKVSRDARALTPSSSRSSAPSPPIVSRPSGLGSGAAHRRARPLSSSSSASSPGSSSSSSASSPRNGPHPWPLSESLGTGPVPSA